MASKTQLESCQTECLALKAELEELKKQSKVQLTSPTGRGRAKGIEILKKLLIKLNYLLII